MSQHQGHKITHTRKRYNKVGENEVGLWRQRPRNHSFLLVLLLDHAILPHEEVGGLAILGVPAEHNHAVVDIHLLTLVEGVLVEVSDDLLDEALGALLEGRHARGVLSLEL